MVGTERNLVEPHWELQNMVDIPGVPISDGRYRVLTLADSTVLGKDL